MENVSRLCRQHAIPIDIEFNPNVINQNENFRQYPMRDGKLFNGLRFSAKQRTRVTRVAHSFFFRINWLECDFTRRAFFVITSSPSPMSFTECVLLLNRTPSSRKSSSLVRRRFQTEIRQRGVHGTFRSYPRTRTRVGTHMV